VQGKRKKGAVDKVRSQANERRDFVSALASDKRVTSTQHKVAGGHTATPPSTSSSSSSSSSSDSHLNTFVMAEVKPDVEPNAVETVVKSSSDAATPSEQAAFEASVVEDKTA
jgi:hypothetical protein